MSLTKDCGKIAIARLAIALPDMSRIAPSEIKSQQLPARVQRSSLLRISIRSAVESDNWSDVSFSDKACPDDKVKLVVGETAKSCKENFEKSTEVKLNVSETRS